MHMYLKLKVDFALDWLFLESGRAVYRQGDESDSTFIVLSGRLRSVITHENGKKELVAEYGKGDLVGIVEMVTQTLRSTTVMAVRDSELAKLPEGLFNVIKLRYPIVVTRLINLLGHRLLGTWKQARTKNGSRDSRYELEIVLLCFFFPISCVKNTSKAMIENSRRTAVDARPSKVNFSTVAIVPISDDVPLTAFTYELYHSLCAIGPCLRLTSDVVRKVSTVVDPFHMSVHSTVQKSWNLSSELLRVYPYSILHEPGVYSDLCPEKALSLNSNLQKHTGH